MRTFSGEYSSYSNGYVYSSDLDTVRLQLLSIMNTPKGTRFYYPDYGTNLYRYKFDVPTEFVINQIYLEIQSAVQSYDGLRLLDSEYKIVDNKIVYYLTVSRGRDKLSLNITFAEGVMA